MTDLFPQKDIEQVMSEMGVTKRTAFENLELFNGEVIVAIASIFLQKKYYGEVMRLVVLLEIFSNGRIPKYTKLEILERDSRSDFFTPFQIFNDFLKI
jgi:hypothetical protein